MSNEVLEQKLNEIKVMFEQQEAQLLEKDSRILSLLDSVNKESDKSDGLWITMYNTRKSLKSINNLLDSDLKHKNEEELVKLILTVHKMTLALEGKLRKILEH